MNRLFSFLLFLICSINSSGQRYDKIIYENRINLSNPITVSSKLELDSILAIWKNPLFKGNEYTQTDSFYYSKLKKNVPIIYLKRSIWICSCNNLSVDLNFLRFGKPLYFSQSAFSGDLANGPLQLQRTTCEEEVIIDHCSFTGIENNFLPGVDGIQIRHSDFNNYFSFRSNVVGTNMYLNDSKFHGGADFSTCDFKGDLDFTNAKFDHMVDFSGSRFHGLLNFLNVTLPDTLIFSRVNEIEKLIDFTTCHLSYTKKCKIDLTNSDISKIRIDFKHFELLFPDSAKDFVKQRVYSLLLNNFLKDGDRDSYKLLDIEFQKYKYEKDNQYFVSWLQGWWWNYGYDKSKIFGNTLILFFVFAFLNFIIALIFGPSLLMRDCYHIPAIWNKVERFEESKKRNWMFFWSLLLYNLIFTALIFFIVRINVDNLSFERKAGLVYLFTIFAGGLTCLGYIINFILNK